MGVTYRIEGADEIVRTMRAWQRRKRAEVVALVTRYVRLIVADTKAAAPKGRTLRLSKSVVADLERVLADLAGAVVVGEFYGRFIEMGTAKLAATPFLVPAFEARAPEFLRELKAILSS